MKGLLYWCYGEEARANSIWHTKAQYLDEVADMSLKAQAKILRILQEKKFERVGGHKLIDMDVRVLAATNKDLEREMEAGVFGRICITACM